MREQLQMTELEIESLDHWKTENWMLSKIYGVVRSR